MPAAARLPAPTLAAGGRSAVLITSRSEEPWLDDAGPARAARPRRSRCAGSGCGLTPQEATEYAGDLLAPYPAAAPRRAEPGVRRADAVAGRPPAEHAPGPAAPGHHRPGGAAGGPARAPRRCPAGTTARAAASPPCPPASATPTPTWTRRTSGCWPPSACSTTSPTPMSWASSPPPMVSRSGSSGVSREAWGEVLDAAAGVGLLTRLGSGMYRIHPALPAYLAARWRTEEPEGYDGQRAAATRALLSAYAAFRRLAAAADRVRRRRARLHRHRPAAAHHGSPARLRAGPAALGRGAQPSPSRSTTTGTAAACTRKRPRGPTGSAWPPKTPTVSPPGWTAPQAALWLFFVGAQAAAAGGQRTTIADTGRAQLAPIARDPGRCSRPRRPIAATQQERIRRRSALPPARHGRAGPGAAG